MVLKEEAVGLCDMGVRFCFPGPLLLKLLEGLPDAGRVFLGKLKGILNHMGHRVRQGADDAAV